MKEALAAPLAQSTSPAPAKAGAGRFKSARSLGYVLLPGVLFLTGALVVPADGSEVAVAVAHHHGIPRAILYRDGPPPGFSGGFGEDHCQACHFGDKVNANPGNLTISAPGRYTPGETYAVTVTLTRPGMTLGGFQLTARFEDDSTQAGTLSFGDADQGRVKVMIDRDMQYAYHVRPGTQLAATDIARWTLRWTAPAGGRAVLFHAAANAANGDDTQFGDFVYTSRARSHGR